VVAALNLTIDYSGKALLSKRMVNEVFGWRIDSYELGSGIPLLWHGGQAEVEGAQVDTIIHH